MALGIVNVLSLLKRFIAKKYACYSDVVIDSGANYDQEHLARVVHDKTLLYAAKNANVIPEFLSSEIDRVSMWFYLLKNKNLSVLDFGGAQPRDF